MKIAALQLACNFADVESNLKKVKLLIKHACQYKVQLVLLPEFFPSAIGFSPKMDHVALEGTLVHETIKRLASELDVIIGGSYLIYDGADCHNTFELVFPNGSIFSHQKDIPTQFENCYYTAGDMLNILHTPIGEIGIALCWEMIRWDTIKRLWGKVDIVLAGSCWWDLPIDAPKERNPLRQYNQKLALETPVTFAKLLHAPLIHANHCGTVAAYNFPANNKLQTRRFVGATQAIDEEGNIIARKEFCEGEGMIVTELSFGHKERQIAEINTNDYWIPNLPDSYIKAWHEVNPTASEYYREHMRPYYQQNYKLSN